MNRELSMHANHVGKWDSAIPAQSQKLNSSSKKKTKCPGEKPMCSFCRRLNQRCVYLQKDKVGTVAFKVILQIEGFENCADSLVKK